MSNSPVTLFPAHYKAVEILGDGPLLVEHPFPEKLDENNVVVKPLLVGVCRSDLKEIMGLRTVPHDFGHEIVGEIQWAGNASGLVRGDTVCFDPHVKIERTSGFGEYIVARGEAQSLSRAFVKLPRERSDEKYVFCEPMACAQHCITNLLKYLNCVSLAGLRVGVIGAGNAGTLISLLAKHLGASLTLFNRSTERLEFLRRRGIFSADELCLLSERCPPSFDVMIATTSFLYSSIMSFAVQGLRPSGLLLLYGGTREGDLLAGTNLDLDRTRRREELIETRCEGKEFRVGGTHGALPVDFTRVIDLLKDCPTDFPVELLISRCIRLDELPEILVSLTKPETPYCGKIVVGRA
jgi:threonine dehydrogenase-like Zn-dependent dehydrogenase